MQGLAPTETTTTTTLTLNAHKVENWPSLLQSLGNNTSFVTLDCNYCLLTHEHVVLLSRALRTNQTLRSLILSRASLTSAELQALCNGLRRNATLTTLDLSRNGIIDHRGWQALSDCLEHGNSSLRHLNLSFNRFNKCAINSLARALAQNRSLERLRLVSCIMPRNAATALPQSLQRNRTLLLLDVSGSFPWRSHREAHRLFWHALTINCTLKHFWLDKDCSRYQIGQWLAVLRTNTTLQTLAIGDPDLHDWAVDYQLAKAIHRNGRFYVYTWRVVNVYRLALTLQRGRHSAHLFARIVKDAHMCTRLIAERACNCELSAQQVETLFPINE